VIELDPDSIDCFAIVTGEFVVLGDYPASEEALKHCFKEHNETGSSVKAMKFFVQGGNELLLPSETHQELHVGFQRVPARRAAQ
jgi:hypothetical protein